MKPHLLHHFLMYHHLLIWSSNKQQACKQALEDLFNWIPPPREEAQAEAKKDKGMCCGCTVTEFYHS